VSVTVCLDAVGQAGQIRVREQFAPALEIESCLPLGRMELDRQRHLRGKFILLIQARQARGARQNVQRHG